MKPCTKHHPVLNAARTQKVCVRCGRPMNKVARRKHERHDRRREPDTQ